MKKIILLMAVLLGIVNAADAQTKFIVIDQFGYLPDAEKIAVIKDPQTGFDSDQSYSPGASYSVIEVSSGDAVFTGTIAAWKSGQTDDKSGDKAWHFDFSIVTDPGTYYILDEERGHKSYDFRIAYNIYNEVLRQAMRTFFYQRVGFPKEAEYAGEGWADGASHTGDLQDPNARSFFAKTDASTERDVSGGWYDAGDFNKYTNWTANYVVEFMKAYLENPVAWGDDYNIPESGNGVADILDENMWGVDHLMRMQLSNGSVLSIVGEAGDSPPSAATGPSYYGNVNTSATNNTAAALAISSTVYRSIGMDVYADTLLKRAEMAWDWADANPAVLFNNNDGAYNSQGLGAGRQETDDYGRQMIKLEAACFLFEATGDTKYRDHFDANYELCHMMQWNFAYPYEVANQDALIYYTSLIEGTVSVKDDIKSTYRNAILNGTHNLPAISGMNDPYMAHMDSYTWGSNHTKSSQGVMYSEIISYDIDPASDEAAYNAALKFVNYIHGVNPLAFVYLSNMYDYGADNGVNEFYHTWFKNGSVKWDRVGESTYGPPPGFLTGGANPGYNWDGCCPSGCGSSSNNAVCVSESIRPPMGQPDQKSYKDFNTSWPLNSWSVTENSCGYQTKYVRMLSKFVTAGMDCNGEEGGSAFFDSCGVCAGGSTGITAILDPVVCEPEIDCNGDMGGVAFMDTCGVCAGGNTGRTPVLVKDDCYDCNGDYNGEAFIDECEHCAGGNTGLVPVLEHDKCYDCNGDFNGLAFVDSCENCAEGNTGVIAIMDPDKCDTGIYDQISAGAGNFGIYPNPSNGELHITNELEVPFHLQMIDLNGRIVFEEDFTGNPQIDINHFVPGYYDLTIKVGEDILRYRIMKL
jgi:endoglucanase